MPHEVTSLRVPDVPVPLSVPVFLPSEANTVFSTQRRKDAKTQRRKELRLCLAGFAVKPPLRMTVKGGSGVIPYATAVGGAPLFPMTADVGQRAGVRSLPQPLIPPGVVS
jgi:hypothetical protein